MPFQPHFVPKARQRGAGSEQPQEMAPLEATGLLPLVAQRGSALPTASVTTHPGCAMRMSVTPGFRRCQGHGRTREDPARGKCTGWMEKVGAANKHQNKTAPKTPLTPRQNRMALPQMPKGGKVFAGTPSSCSFFQDPLGEKAPAAEGEQRPRTLLLQGKAKQKASRSRGSPRHFRSKWQGVKLPPVPSITNLNFSRNFTFSFFELPPHQGPQYWLQRQQLIRLLMKQLQ
ncbi:uncharacterized protein LOC128408537 isoform X3 [Podarcis raffonei]|uniref:uncharacterized protein LOC128408537 isoform X3 n=1 Tax=Podarcis raffonei TaxID=65483 RepID=UPI00232918E4|nr:uncharacterized protein LOC128408537 isoform X3 [Podarcis raffonei]